VAISELEQMRKEDEKVVSLDLWRRTRRSPGDRAS